MTGHPDLRFLLDPEAGSPPERQRALQHLRICPDCRAAVAQVDPTRLFALLALATVPPGTLDRLAERVSAAIDAEALPHRRPLRRGLLASLAASVLLAIVFGTYLWVREGAVPGPASAWSSAPMSPFVHQDIELHSPREADVVSFSVGDTQLVMIFDEGLGL